jgi:hypothetical protein
VEKEGSSGGELGGGARRLSGWCDTTAGSGCVGSGSRALSRVRVRVFRVAAVMSSGDTTGYRSLEGSGRDPMAVR